MIIRLKQLRTKYTSKSRQVRVLWSQRYPNQLRTAWDLQKYIRSLSGIPSTEVRKLHIPPRLCFFITLVYSSFRLVLWVLVMDQVNTCTYIYAMLRTTIHTYTNSQQRRWKCLMSYSKQEIMETVTGAGAQSCSPYRDDDIANCLNPISIQ